MTYEIATALNVTNGDVVLLDSVWRTVHAAHYAGDVNGIGVTTLEHAGGEWQGASSLPLVRVAS